MAQVSDERQFTLILNLREMNALYDILNLTINANIASHASENMRTAAQKLKQDIDREVEF